MQVLAGEVTRVLLAEEGYPEGDVPEPSRQVPALPGTPSKPQPGSTVPMQAGQEGRSAGSCIVLADEMGAVTDPMLKVRWQAIMQ